MEITRTPTAGVLELRIRGRLDGYWADHLQQSLAETMREGHERIRLDLSDVRFMSSAGIAVLMKCYKQLQRIDGSLVVTRPSAVRTVLEMTGLAGVLIEAGEPAAVAQPGPVDGTRVERAGAVLEIFDLTPAAEMRCRVIGTDAPLKAGAFAEEHCAGLPLRDPASPSESARSVKPFQIAATASGNSSPLAAPRRISRPTGPTFRTIWSERELRHPSCRSCTAWPARDPLPGSFALLPTPPAR